MEVSLSQETHTYLSRPIIFKLPSCQWLIQEQQHITAIIVPSLQNIIAIKPKVVLLIYVLEKSYTKVREEIYMAFKFNIYGALQVLQAMMWVNILLLVYVTPI
jgi:hypothetical protein